MVTTQVECPAGKLARAVDGIVRQRDPLLINLGPGLVFWRQAVPPHDAFLRVPHCLERRTISLYGLEAVVTRHDQHAVERAEVGVKVEKDDVSVDRLGRAGDHGKRGPRDLQLGWIVGGHVPSHADLDIEVAGVLVPKDDVNRAMLSIRIAS